MAYDAKLKEEEIKNKVAADWFPAYDCTRILGNVDFCVQPKEEGPTLWETESLLWAEAKAGAVARAVEEQKMPAQILDQVPDLCNLIIK